MGKGARVAACFGLFLALSAAGAASHGSGLDCYDDYGRHSVSVEVEESSAAPGGGGRRALLATALIADMAIPLLTPVVDLALKPVEIIALEWIVNPITYQIKRSYAAEGGDVHGGRGSPSPLEGGGVPEGGVGEPQEPPGEEVGFWGSLGRKITSIFVIDDVDDEEEGVIALPEGPMEVSKSNKGVILIDENTTVVSTTSESGQMHVEMVPTSGGVIGEPAAARKVESRSALLRRYTPGGEDQSWRENSVSLSRSASRGSSSQSAGWGGPKRAIAPGKVALLKCGKIHSSVGRTRGSNVDRHVVSGSEASLVMKLEGFTPFSAVVLFGSQELPGEFGLPTPVVSNALLRRTIRSLDESLAGRRVGTECDGVRLGLGGLVDTIDMSLDTPHKILRIVNHTNGKGTTFVQRMKFTERYCTGPLYFQALDLATCKLTSVVNATMPTML
ncbi:hypothetical protein HOP50_02g11080 [Chloropicon primus]|uniref:Uncharacterized protein n=1 Tax=Chloropicon primus TaxID=1764295 RepID=A0A5B8MEK8_9CHLO|nr:hypothetical protein A3770_02p11220 [Chloropicon primus]UPQ97813.1 hypothetical protein HOP50_02g11080 [Chloropicon primus]|eukprot:QDZ18604.1 hypothetical protein A3770_02p11220 [Chloropicon primus]